jgi:hypothetical protein
MSFANAPPATKEAGEARFIKREADGESVETSLGLTVALPSVEIFLHRVRL